MRRGVVRVAMPTLSEEDQAFKLPAMPRPPQRFNRRPVPRVGGGLASDVGLWGGRGIMFYLSFTLP
jgi:hypothetical protein